MHILIIPSWYSSPQSPIRGSFFREQALALRKAGYTVGMLVPPTKLRSRHGLAETRAHWRTSPTAISVTEDQGLTVFRMPWWGLWAAANPWARGPLAQTVFAAYVRSQGRPDLIHGHSLLYGGYLAAYLGQRNGIAAVATEHSSNFLTGRILPPQEWFARYALRHLNVVLAVSPPLATALEARLRGLHVRILPNMVDTQKFFPPANEPPDRPFRFAAVGALIPLKGHDILIRAFVETFRGEPVQLEIAGAGPQRQRLDALIARINGGAQVRLMGMQTRDQVRDLLQRSHALVSASLTENHPVSMLEALACGRPIVATRCNGPEYFLDERHGVLVAPNDASALGAAMRQVVSNYAQFDRAAIRADCVARFGESAVVAQLKVEYEIALGRAEERLMGT